MTIFASPTDASEVAETYSREIQRVLYDEPIPSVDELEKHALLCLPSILHPAIPVEAARLFVSVLEERADAIAAGAMCVYARIGSGPLGEAAAAALARMEVTGVVSPWHDEIGTLRIDGCRRGELPHGDTAYALRLVRGGRPRRAQNAIVMIGHPDCGPTVGMVTVGTRAAGDPRQLFDMAGVAATEAEPQELREVLEEALAHMIEHEHPLLEFLIGELAMLDVALTGRPGTLPRPLLLAADDPEAMRFLAAAVAMGQGVAANRSDRRRRQRARRRR